MHLYLDDVGDVTLKTISLVDRKKDEAKGLPMECVHLYLITNTTSIYIQTIPNEIDTIRIAANNDVDRKRWLTSLKQSVKKSDSRMSKNPTFEFSDIYDKNTKSKSKLELSTLSSLKKGGNDAVTSKLDDTKNSSTIDKVPSADDVNLISTNSSDAKATHKSKQRCKDLANKSLDDCIKDIQLSHTSISRKAPAGSSKCSKLFCGKCCRKIDQNEADPTAIDTLLDSEKDDDSEVTVFRLLGVVRLSTIYQFFKIAASFPLVLVLSKVSTKSIVMPPLAITILMNAVIYVVPFILFTYVLHVFPSLVTQQVVLGVYTSFYILPALYSIVSKLWWYRSAYVIDIDMICLKPSTTLGYSVSNAMCIVGMGIEWIQHSAYTLPLDVVTPLGNQWISTVKYPPYLGITAYSWFAIASAFLCGLVLILKASFRGKASYYFNNSRVIWSLVYCISYPLFLSMMTVLYMVFVCDSDGYVNHDTDVKCYNAMHKKLGICAFIAIAVILLQSTLLPTGSYIETSSNINLDINFPPIYLQTEYILKAVFAYVYVFFYEYNYVRIPILTFINIVLMLLNGIYAPCCVPWVNILRSTIFIHGSFVGIQSLNYTFWPATVNKTLILTTMGSNCCCIAFTMFLYYRHSRRSADVQVKQSFVHLECDGLRTNKVSPRALEPLIARSLTKDSSKWGAVKSFIPKLSCLICFPDNARVQFLACWALSNIAILDEDARQQILASKAVKFIRENYDTFHRSIELQSLAVIANLAISYRFSQDFVTYNFIPFLLELVISHKYQHSIFATVAIGNLARDENLRKLIVQSGGIQALVNCILSSDYEKKRYGCLALGNIALSVSDEILNVLDSNKFMRCVIKIATRHHVHGHKEALCLLRNMCGHTRFRKLLVERNNIDVVIKRCRKKFNSDTKKLCDEILKLTAREKDSSRSDGVSEHLQLKRNVRFEDEETFNTPERKRRKTFYQECMVATTFTSAAPGDLTVKKTQKSSPFYSKGLMHINDIKIKMSNVLFDTGASNSSYISEEFVIKHRQQMEPFIFPHRSLVTLGDGLTKCAITECLIVPCSFADERGKEHKGIVKFSIFKTSGEFIIIGVPDICTSFRILVIQMILGYEDDHVESEVEKLGKTFKQNSLIDRVPIDVDAGFKYYIDVDAENAFHQVDLSEAKSNKLSIITPCELYRPLSMPEGISSAKYKASFEKKEDAPSNSCTLHLPDCNNSSVCLAQTEESTFTNL